MQDSEDTTIIQENIICETIYTVRKSNQGGVSLLSRDKRQRKQQGGTRESGRLEVWEKTARKELTCVGKDCNTSKYEEFKETVKLA